MALNQSLIDGICSRMISLLSGPPGEKGNDGEAGPPGPKASWGCINHVLRFNKVLVQLQPIHNLQVLSIIRIQSACEKRRGKSFLTIMYKGVSVTSLSMSSAFVCVFVTLR